MALKIKGLFSILQQCEISKLKRSREVGCLLWEDAYSPGQRPSIPCGFFYCWPIV